MKFFGNQNVFELYGRGEKTVIAQLYDIYFPVLFRFVRRFTRTSEDAEDVTGEVFVKLIDHPVPVDNEQKFKAYLFRIAKNTCLDYIKRTRRRETKERFLPQPEINVLEYAMERAEERAEFQFRFQKAVDRLPPRCRIIFNLFFVDRLKNVEIAVRLKISEKTVANQRTEAIRRLRLDLKQMNHTAESVVFETSYKVNYLLNSSPGYRSLDWIKSFF